MRYRYLVLLLLCSPAFSEDLLLNQCANSGTQCSSASTLTAQDWTDITSSMTGLVGTKLPYYVTGWDKYFYVPAIDAMCGVGSYYEPSSEPNRNWSCYSFKENRWWLEDMGGPFHNEHLPEGGHPIGFQNVDPTNSVGVGFQGASGSQVQELNKWGMFRYDFFSQVGIPQQPAMGVTASNQLGTATYDPFNALIIGFGGDSASQGHIQYDNTATHTTCGAGNNGVNCYNTWALEKNVTTGGLPISIILHATAMDNANAKAYLTGGFASLSGHNWVWNYTVSSTTWTNVFVDTNSSAQVTSSLSSNYAITTGVNDKLSIKIDGGGAQSVTLTNGSLSCSQVVTLLNAQVTGTLAWCPLNPGGPVQFMTDSNLGSGSTIEFVATANSAYATLGFTVGVNSGTNAAACTDLNGLHNCPQFRMEPSWAYDDADDIFLMHGGCRFSNISGCTNTAPKALLTDTWAFSPSALTWTQVNTAHTPAYTNGLVANERMTYIKEDDVFLIFTNPSGSNNPHMYAFRYRAGGKPGYVTRAYNYTSPSAGIGPLNRNTVDSTHQGWAYGSTIAGLGSVAAIVHTETATAQTGASPANSWLLHPYAQTFSASSTCGSLDTNFACLGTTYASMSPDVGGNPRQAFDISCAYVASQLWCSWHQEDAGLTETVFAKGWDGSTWGGSGLGGAITQMADTVYDGQTKIIAVGSTPTVLIREQFRKTGLTAGVSVGATTVLTTSGVTGVATGMSITISGATGCWAVVNNSGNPQNATTVTLGTSFSVAKDTSACTPPMTGTVLVNANSPYPTYCTVRQWNGSSWPIVGSQPVNLGWSVCDGASIATDGGGTNMWVSYTSSGPQTVAGVGFNGTWIGPPQTFLTKWNGSVWAQQGSTANVSSSGACTGFLTGSAPPTYVGTNCSRAYNTDVTVLGGIPYVTFAERLDAGIKQDLRVRSFNSGWASVGPASLNKDTLNGWTFRPQITNDATKLFLTWTEQGNPQTWIGTFASPANTPIAQRPHVYAASLTTGGTLAYMGGALNVNTEYGSATHPEIAIFAGQPIIDWGEVKQGNARQIYAKMWDASKLDWGAINSSALAMNSPGALAPSTVGATYSQSITSQASGGTPPYGSWTIATGSLPTGLSLGSSTGLITGTVGGSAGTSTFTISVTDAIPNTATSSSETITINAVPAITTASPLPAGVVSVAYSQTLAATGGTLPLTWTISAGTLAGSGLSLSSGGVVSGVPTTAAVYSFTAKATDNVSIFDTKAFSVTITGGVVPTGSLCVSCSVSPGVTIQ